MLPKIPKEFYTSSEHFRLEWERMWTRVWLVAGRLADIPEAGDLFTFEIGPESILVVRQGDGGVRAFYNACQHRGHFLRESGVHRGGMPVRCPYHGWVYGVDGGLKHLPDAHCFRGRAAVGETQLTELRADTFAGFAFVSMDPRVEPLRDYLGPLAEFVEAYRFHEWELVDDMSIELDANWKTALDAWSENYHVQGVHRQLLTAIDDTQVKIEHYERHSRLIVPFAIPSSRLEDRDSVGEALADLMRQAGLDPAAFAGRAGDVRAAMIEAGRRAAAAQNLDVSALRDEQFVDAHNFHFFPNVTLNAWFGRALLYRYRPHPTDASRAIVDYQTYERPARGVRPKTVRFRYGQRPVDTVMTQDLDAVSGVQRGMASRGFSGVELGDSEGRIRFLHEVLGRYLSGGDGRGT